MSLTKVRPSFFRGRNKSQMLEDETPESLAQSLQKQRTASLHSIGTQQKKADLSSLDGTLRLPEIIKRKPTLPRNASIDSATFETEQSPAALRSKHRSSLQPPEPKNLNFTMKSTAVTRTMKLADDMAGAHTLLKVEKR